MLLLKPSTRYLLVHTYVINGDVLDYFSIENALRRNGQFEIHRPWLNKQYLGIYRNRTYLLLFITVLVRRIFAELWTTKKVQGPKTGPCCAAKS